MNTLTELRLAPIIHTDEGEFLVIDNKPEQEFYVKGIITKKRAGLFFININDESYSIHAKAGFNMGDEVKVLLQLQVQDNKHNFVVKNIEPFN